MKSLQPSQLGIKPPPPLSQDGTSKVEGRAEGSTSFALFLRRGRRLLSQGSGGLLTLQERASLGSPLHGLHGKWLLSWGMLPSPDKHRLSLFVLILFPAKRTFSAFQGLGRGHRYPHTPQNQFFHKICSFITGKLEDTDKQRR